MAAGKVLRFGTQLKELRFHLCQKSPESQGVRDFITKYYVPIKKANPKFPILIRECSGVSPKVYARFEYGKENSRPLAGLNVDQVFQAVEGVSSGK